MVRLTVLVLSLASTALAAEALPPWQDELTLSPLPTVQRHVDQSAAAVDLKEPAPQEMIVNLEQPISLDARVLRPPRSSDELGGFIYEPVYTQGDRVEYQLGSGLGLGVGSVI